MLNPTFFIMVPRSFFMDVSLKPDFSPVEESFPGVGGLVIKEGGKAASTFLVVEAFWWYPAAGWFGPLSMRDNPMVHR